MNQPRESEANQPRDTTCSLDEQDYNNQNRSSIDNTNNNHSSSILPAGSSQLDGANIKDLSQLTDVTSHYKNDFEKRTDNDLGTPSTTQRNSKKRTHPDESDLLLVPYKFESNITNPRQDSDLEGTSLSQSQSEVIEQLCHSVIEQQQSIADGYTQSGRVIVNQEDTVLRSTGNDNKLVGMENISLPGCSSQASFKCTNCRVLFPDQMSFIGHLTCGAQVKSEFKGNCIGGMPVRKENEVSSSTSKPSTQSHNSSFYDVTAHQCAACDEAFESLRHNRTFCTDIKLNAAPIATGTCTTTKLWHPKPPEVIDLTDSRSTSPDGPPLSPQSASDLQRVPCEICGKRFKNKYTLKTHYRIHSNQRPFSCSVCFKSFKEKGVLKSHEKTHTDERPFMCPVCLKCFKAKGTLKTHMKQTHPT